MKQHFIGAVMAAAMACAQASSLPEGSVITGLANGSAAGLLGLDQGFAAVAGSNVTALAAADLEYLTADYAIGIDFFTDGRVQVYANTDDGTLPGVTVLEFSFAGLNEAFSGLAMADNSAITGGNVALQVLGPQSLRLTITDLTMQAPYASFTAQVSTVPEPAAAWLAAAGLAGVFIGARRRQEGRA